HRDLHSFPTRRSSDLLFRYSTATFLMPASLASLAIATPCSASDGQVRNQTPCVLPCSASSVNIGDVEDGDTCTTLLPAVTDVRIDRKSTRLNSSHVKI